MLQVQTLCTLLPKTTFLKSSVLRILIISFMLFISSLPRLVIMATIWPLAVGGMLRPVPSLSRLFLDRTASTKALTDKVNVFKCWWST